MANGLGSKQLGYSIQERQPYLSELNFFKKNLHVGGMAAEDNRIIMNPYSPLSLEQKNAVRKNERARVYMRISGNEPNFAITPEQQQAFGSYGSPQDIRETLVGRILSGDTTALNFTPEQEAFTQQLYGNQISPQIDYPIYPTPVFNIPGRNQWKDKLKALGSENVKKR